MPAIVAPLVELAAAHAIKKGVEKGVELLSSHASPSITAALGAERPMPGLGANNPAPK